MRERIVVVDDDPTILDCVSYTLEADAMVVQSESTAGAAVATARRGDGDLYILDIGLPDGSGLEACRAIRSISDVPILILSARDSEVDMVLGLEAGADDYVVKPFSLVVLRSRVRAMLRRRELQRQHAGDSQTRRVGDLTVDILRHMAIIAGREVSLTRAEFKLLLLLSQQPERVYTRRQIMEQLWDSTYVGDLRACDVHISALRRKLDTPGMPSRIVTVRGVGYKLIPVDLASTS